MRKTKNLAITLKALLLIFALSFLCTLQSNAQSRDTSSPNMTPTETVWDMDFTIRNFFDWLKTIVTLDMSRKPGKQKPGLYMPSDTPPDLKNHRTAGNSSLIIVTPDMTVRDPDDNP